MVKLLSSFPLTERTYRYTASSKHDADIYRMCSGSDSSTRRKPRPVYFCGIAVPNPREHSCWSDQPAKQRMGVSMRSNSIKRISEYWIHQKCVWTMPFLLGVIVLLYRIFYRNTFLTTEDRSERAKDRATFASRQIKGQCLLACHISWGRWWGVQAWVQHSISKPGNSCTSFCQIWALFCSCWPGWSSSTEVKVGKAGRSVQIWLFFSGTNQL